MEMAIGQLGPRQATTPETPEREEVLQFWFPDHPDEDQATHSQHWRWRWRVGADEEILVRFSGITARAAAGDLDHWANDPQGRLALRITLNQFLRSVWRG